MNLVALNIDSIHLGAPLPFALRSANGVLLAQKGFVIRNRQELDQLVARGVSLCVDTDESGDSQRAYRAQLQEMLISEKPLGQIASMQITAGKQAPRTRVSSGPPDWPELQMRATQLLRTPQIGDFDNRFLALHNELARISEQTPDAALLALIHISALETRMYSATHAMLVACICMVAAREVLRWNEMRVQQLGCVALSMNIGMTDLQDQLTQRTEPLTALQITAVEEHASHSETLLRKLGVSDPVWLEAVRCHHHRMPGPLSQKSEAQQIARLVQRADLFAARLAPRASRQPMSVTAALQISYHDENQQVDEAGAALVKALGIYPPGAYVRLVSNEVAVVLRRGPTATTPRVAVVTNRTGMPTGEGIPRDTAQPSWKVTGVAARKDVRVQIPLDRLLALV